MNGGGVGGARKVVGETDGGGWRLPQFREDKMNRAPKDAEDAETTTDDEWKRKARSHRVQRGATMEDPRLRESRPLYAKWGAKSNVMGHSHVAVFYLLKRVGASLTVGRSCLRG